MVECEYCQQTLDVDEVTAGGLGWRAMEEYEDTSFDPPRYYVTWYCPHCVSEHNPCAKSKRL